MSSTEAMPLDTAWYMLEAGLAKPTRNITHGNHCLENVVILSSLSIPIEQNVQKNLQNSVVKLRAPWVAPMDPLLLLCNKACWVAGLDPL